MSKSQLRATITKKLLKNFNSKSAKSVAEASRKVTQSGKVKQCLIVNNRAMDAMKAGFEYGINRNLEVSGRDYQTYVKKALIALSAEFPVGRDDLGAEAFLELVAAAKLKWGSAIIYLPFSFRTIKTKIHEINEAYAKTLESTGRDGPIKYSRRAYGKATHLDHGADGFSSGLMGSVVGAMASKERATSDLPKDFDKKFEDNLLDILENEFGGILASQAGDIKIEIDKLMANWEQFIDKNGNLKADFSMMLTPVSSKANLEASAMEKMIQQAFLLAFEAAWKDIDYADIKGSSSLREKAEKFFVYDQIIAPLSKIPGIKIKTHIKKNTQLKTKTKLDEKGEKSKGSKVKYWGATGKKAGKPANKQPQAAQRSMFSVMAIINEKLPQTVKKNMGAPRLENRTGRFAQSARITDVSATAQGHPSFGYTYDKNPYQVYESGKGRSPWADGHRDPRSLIDASIREIAANLALGRFYTRRV